VIYRSSRRWDWTWCLNSTRTRTLITSQVSTSFVPVTVLLLEPNEQRDARRTGRPAVTAAFFAAADACLRSTIFLGTTAWLNQPALPGKAHNHRSNRKPESYMEPSGVRANWLMD
jgi:hypothetical protein